MTSPVAPTRNAARIARAPGDRPAQVDVEVLFCGSTDGGDDGAPAAAARGLADQLDPSVRLRVVGQLAIDDLLAVPAGASVVVVDTATGLRRGEIVDLPLDGLVARDDDLRARSSRSLEFREVLGVANMLRGRPLTGRIVAIGGRKFGRGTPLSPSVAKGIPALIRAIVDAIGRLRG
jgi:hydrogenase maturation protease